MKYEERLETAHATLNLKSLREGEASVSFIAVKLNQLPRIACSPSQLTI